MVQYENLVLSGGSVRGFCQIGAIKKLIEEGLLDLKKLKGVAGTSAGAILALLIVLGFDIDEIWNFILDIDIKKLVNMEPLLIFKKFGADSGQIVYNILDEIVSKKFGAKQVNFKQLYELNGIDFTVVGACLTTKQEIHYNHINTPNFKVSVAVRISISMPGVFTPVEIDGNKYIDGGILNNYPMSLFEDKLDKTIGIMICNESDTNYDCPEGYFMAIMNLFLYQHYQRSCEKYKNNTIYVKEQVPGISLISFNLDNIKKQALWTAGYNAAKAYIASLESVSKPQEITPVDTIPVETVIDVPIEPVIDIVEPENVEN